MVRLVPLVFARGFICAYDIYNYFYKSSSSVLSYYYTRSHPTPTLCVATSSRTILHGFGANLVIFAGEVILIKAGGTFP